MEATHTKQSCHDCRTSLKPDCQEIRISRITTENYRHVPQTGVNCDNSRQQRHKDSHTIPNTEHACLLQLSIIPNYDSDGTVSLYVNSSTRSTGVITLRPFLHKTSEETSQITFSVFISLFTKPRRNEGKLCPNFRLDQLELIAKSHRLI